MQRALTIAWELVEGLVLVQSSSGRLQQVGTDPTQSFREDELHGQVVLVPQVVYAEETRTLREVVNVKIHRVENCLTVEADFFRSEHSS